MECVRDREWLGPNSIDGQSPAERPHRVSLTRNDDLVGRVHAGDHDHAFGPGEVPADHGLRREYGVPTGYQQGPFFQLQTEAFALIAVDTGVLKQVDEEQLTWLRAALDRADGKVVLALLGHPPLAGGLDQTRDNEPFAAITRLLREHHVHVVMAGDTHDLEYYRQPVTDDGKPGAVHYFVNGGGGAYQSFGTALAWPAQPPTAVWAFYPTRSDVASKIIHAAVSSLTELGRRIDVAVLDEVATRLASARRIDCYSVGAASTFMASELQSRLFRLGCTSNAIFDAHQQLVSASTLGPDGVAFVISHVGRMPYTLEAARFARSQGATVVALTQPDTQLAEIADLVLAVSVPQDAVMRVGTEAYLAHLVVIEILMVRLAQKLGPVATRGLQQFKQLLHKHGFDSAEYSGATESNDERP